MLKGEIVKSYLARFPKAASKTLALLIYRENPEVWTDVETVRTLVRMYRGNKGKYHREKMKDKTFYKENGVSGNPFIKLPEGEKSLDWNVFKIVGTEKILILSDIHIPYYDKNILEIAIEGGKKIEPTVILLNGDICDHYSQSRWETDPRERDFPYEIELTKLFLAYLRQNFPKSRIIWKHGNHEERYERYMMLKAPELLGIPDFEYERVYDLAKYGVELVKDKRPMKINKLHVIHGHEYKFVISNPVNPARGLFLRAKANCLCGHFHQSSTHSGKNIDDKIITTWSTGSLCELHPKYMPLNEHNHGFATVETDGDESFLVNNYKIINDKIYNA